MSGCQIRIRKNNIAAENDFKFFIFEIDKMMWLCYTYFTETFAVNVCREWKRKNYNIIEK